MNSATLVAALRPFAELCHRRGLHNDDRFADDEKICPWITVGLLRAAARALAEYEAAVATPSDYSELVRELREVVQQGEFFTHIVLPTYAKAAGKEEK